MFIPCSEPVHFDEAELRSLRFSTNAAAVATRDLPEGEARAAIAVHEEASGTFRVTVAVCSVEVPKAVFYVYDDDLTEASRTLAAAETALDFAQGMGFSFGDDAVATGDPGARSRAIARWRTLVGVDPEEPRAAFGELGGAAVEPGGGGAVLTLDRQMESGEARAAKPPLSKFRRDPVPPPSTGKLGRMQLVKRPVPLDSGGASKLLLRLLGAF